MTRALALRKLKSKSEELCVISQTYLLMITSERIRIINNLAHTKTQRPARCIVATQIGVVDNGCYGELPPRL